MSVNTSKALSTRSVSNSSAGAWTVLVEVLAAFDAAGIRYAVLGDTSKFPALDGDVDISIRRQDFPALERVLMDFRGSVDATLVQAIQHEQTSVFYILAWKDSQGAPVFLQLDICSDYFRSGRLIMTADELLDSRLQLIVGDAAIYVPGSYSRFVYYLAKKVKKGMVDNNQRSYLRHVWTTLSPESRQAAAAFFEGCSVTDLGRCLEDNGDISSLHGKLRDRTSLVHTLREKSRLAKRALGRTGLFVVMMGPDGSGKTTINARARKLVATAFWNEKYMHFRPFVGASDDDSEIVEDPHASPPRSSVTSILKLTYYVADYLAGFFSKVRPTMARSGLVIFDRYYEDMQIDPLRYRYGGPRSLLRIAQRAVPRPDLYIFLDVDPDVIQSRKQEVSAEETRRQVEAYRSLAETLPNAVICNGEKHPDAVANCAAWQILDSLSGRTLKRLGGRNAVV